MLLAALLLGHGRLTVPLSIKEKVLKFLGGTEHTYTNKELAKILDLDQKLIAHATKQLTKELKLLQFATGPGRSYKYGFKGNVTPPVRDPQQIAALARRWADNKWKPKVESSTKNLPISIARLYEKSYDIVYGSVITDKDLNNIKQSLEELARDLQNTLVTVQSFLITDELWDPNLIGHFLYGEHLTPDLAKLLAAKIKAHYT